MFLSRHGISVMLVVCIAAGIIATVSAMLLARSIGSDSRTLHSDVRALGRDAGAHRRAGGLATAEMESVRRELAATAARLSESREHERAMERSRHELVAWVAHDLRTPLADLRTMAEALEGAIAADPGLYHTGMRRSVDQLTEMAEDLFELSRIHAGPLRLALEQVSLTDLADGAVVGAAPLARARGVELTAHARGRLTVYVDPMELSRAMANLVTTAVQHTPAGGAVRVDSGHRDGRAVLTVSDTCGGLPADRLNLGRAAVRGIVQAHAGEVEVRDTADGCQVEIRLPIPRIRTRYRHPDSGRSADPGQTAAAANCASPGPKPTRGSQPSSDRSRSLDAVT